MSNQLELKHIRGIPYYVQGTIVHTFELSPIHPGKPSSECIPIGAYESESDSILYYDDWKQLVQSRLDAFRASLQSQERNTLRQNLVKPQKPRKSTRNPRKTTTRTKNPQNQ